MDDVIANFLRLVSIFISDDFPTFERPMKAYSWQCVSGHLPTLELLTSNLASFMVMVSALKILVKLNI